jgi:protein SCO1/2/putative membrane protein
VRPLLATALFLSLAGCARRADLPIYGHVPAFTLTSESGATFDSRALDGKVWVADFFFTTCLGPCPRMSSLMHSIQKRTADLADVRLVSFSVDPEHDTAPVLAAYAARFRADPARWSLLTGSAATLDSLARDTFKMGNAGGEFGHSTLFALVDRRGFIRGYYHTEEGESLDPLIADLRRLAAGGADSQSAASRLVSTRRLGFRAARVSKRSNKARPMTVHDLPAVNAALNATAAVLLVWGFALIRSGRKRTHRRVMLAAFTVSALFLVCYVIYHASVGAVRFAGTGAIRALYLSILFTHTLLAAAVPPLAIVTLSRGLRGRFDRHRAIARWTLPIWLYVSVTGVVVYWMLYRM